LSSGGAERSIKRIAALSRSALVRHVQVTPQEVHHHRRSHENGQRLAGNVAKPDKSGPVPTGTDCTRIVQHRAVSLSPIF
jgi:hypothetical protein